MHTEKHVFFTLLLMISFASVNAVLFTPALPTIANFFSISEGTAQLTITWFLIGYALGQLIYGPIANRFGRKKALYAGIILQIASSLLCVLAGAMHDYSILILGRFLLALGSGVGLKMTFTLVNELYEPLRASQLMAYLMIAFAITPGLGVMLGSMLSTQFGWTSTFYAGAVYGCLLLLLTTRLPETKLQLDKQALQLKHLMSHYFLQFKNLKLISGGLLMGGATCFVYLFAALAPFIAMNMLHMDAATYGKANLLPPIGMVLGSFASAQLIKKYSSLFVINLGIFIALIGSTIMLMLVFVNASALLGIFVPMMLCYFGLSLIFANASTIAMSHTTDKAHGSAVMSFTNMGLATIILLSISELPIHIYLLPAVFIGICFFMGLLNRFALQPKHA